MNFKTLWADVRIRTALLVGAGVLVALGAFLIVGATDETPGWIPASLTGAADTADDSSESADTSGSPRAQAGGNAKPVSNGTGDDTDANTDDGTSDAPAPNATSTPAPPTGDPADPAVTPPAKTMALRILYWNDTESKAVTSLRVSIGDKTWSPTNPGAESATGKLSGLPFDQKLTLVVMPDGPDGKRVEVPVLFTTDMVADSEGDAVHVEIKDGTVRVLGTPVDNFDLTQDRF